MYDEMQIRVELLFICKNPCRRTTNVRVIVPGRIEVKEGDGGGDAGIHLEI